MALMWNANQLAILDRLMAGVKYVDIAKELHTTKQTIATVSNAIKTGHIPKGEKYEALAHLAVTPGTVKSSDVKASSKADAAQTVAQYAKTEAQEIEPEVLENDPLPEPEGDHVDGDGTDPPPPPETPPPANPPPPPETPPPANPPLPGGGVSLSAPPPDLTTVLKLITVPTNCALTPIMQNARMAAIYELGWNPKMPWEDFFDNCLIYLFGYWGIHLKGYYTTADLEAEESGGNTHIPSPSPAGGNGQKKSQVASIDELDQKYKTVALEFVKWLQEKEKQAII